MVSHLEICLPEKPLAPKYISEDLKGPQKNSVQYDKNKNVSLLLDPIPIKYLPEGTKFLYLLIAPSIKEGDYSYAWKFVACHCSNGDS